MDTQITKDIQFLIVIKKEQNNVIKKIFEIEEIYCVFSMLFSYVSNCAYFGWGRFNFLHCTCSGAVLWICADHRADNAEIFFYYC